MLDTDFLGFQFIDEITGFKGTCTGFCTYVSGCAQALLVPKTNAEGKIQESHWFDAQRLTKIITTPQVKLDNSRSPGCDMGAPKR